MWFLFVVSLETVILLAHAQSPAKCQIVAKPGGYWQCTYYANDTSVCAVYCNSVYQGNFTCKNGGKFQPDLPDCVSQVGSSQDQCGPNQQQYDCGPTCKDTCETYNQTNVACPRYCKSGCFCKPGYVKDKNGNCIPTSQCPQKTEPCPKNEQPSDCVIPCNDCETRGKCNFLVCNKGCDCKEGFYRNDKGSCIPESQCPTQAQSPAKCQIVAKPGGYWQCTYYANDTSVCAVYCNSVYQGNFTCKNGGKFQPDLPDCVSQVGSSQDQCGPNQQQYDCVPTCKNTCETYNQTNVACPQYCQSGCFCKPGYVKDKNGNCIPTSQCPQKTDVPSTTPTPTCRKKEKYYTCMPECQNTCLFYTSPNKYACKMPCRAGCFCKKRYVKADNGTCVRRNECLRMNSPKKCGSDEQYYQCTPSCKNNCDTYFNPGVRCACGPPGCFCKEGLVKRMTDMKCIPPEQCKTAPSSNKCDIRVIKGNSQCNTKGDTTTCSISCNGGPPNKYTCKGGKFTPDLPSCARQI